MRILRLFLELYKIAKGVGQVTLEVAFLVLRVLGLETTNTDCGSLLLLVAVIGVLILVIFFSKEVSVIADVYKGLLAKCPNVNVTLRLEFFSFHKSCFFTIIKNVLVRVVKGSHTALQIDWCIFLVWVARHLHRTHWHVLVFELVYYSFDLKN